jgi:hypothetical protein
MKKNHLIATLVGVISSMVGLLAQPFSGHYPVGVEGIKCGSVPPPGIYLRDYNVFYSADRFKDGPSDFDILGYINAARLIWVSDFKILGANWGTDLIVPFGYIDWKVAGASHDYFGIGDIYYEPVLLAWHPKRFDIGIGYSFWAPTGEYSQNRPSLLWKGFWSHMFTAGMTYYLDSAKTWAISVLNRYEIHTQHNEIDITPGDTYSLEWGVSKAIAKSIEVGLVGYYQQQVTDDSGSAVNYDKSIYDRVIGLGPEILMFCPRLNLFTSLRYCREFSATQRPEGNLISLTFTKRF